MEDISRTTLQTRSQAVVIAGALEQPLKKRRCPLGLPQGLVLVNDLANAGSSLMFDHDTTVIYLYGK